MTVSEFIEWLKTQDQDAIVQCIVRDDYPVKVVDFTPYLSWLTDFRNNPRITPDRKQYQKAYLLIGED